MRKLYVVEKSVAGKSKPEHYYFENKKAASDFAETDYTGSVESVNVDDEEVNELLGWTQLALDGMIDRF